LRHERPDTRKLTDGDRESRGQAEIVQRERLEASRQKIGWRLPDAELKKGEKGKDVLSGLEACKAATKPKVYEAEESEEVVEEKAIAEECDVIREHMKLMKL